MDILRSQMLLERIYDHFNAAMLTASSVSYMILAVVLVRRMYNLVHLATSTNQNMP